MTPRRPHARPMGPFGRRRRNRRDSHAAAKRTVRRGWNRVSRIYRPDAARRDAFGHDVEDHLRWLQPLWERLEPGASVLDLGCGCGVPDSALLSPRFRVTGVDISDVQVARARALVPEARFVRADMTTVDFGTARFHAVVCVYSLIHVPLPEQRALLERIRRWLRPGGLLVVVTGWSAWTGTESNWLGSGAPMYWSHADAATYARWFREIGFRTLSRTTIPEGEAAHELFVLLAPPVPGGPPRPHPTRRRAPPLRARSPPAKNRGRGRVL